MCLLKIDEEGLKQVNELKKIAFLNVMKIEEDQAPIKDSKFSISFGGLNIVFSYEKDEVFGLSRHICLSFTKEKKMPSPVVTNEALFLFGFKQCNVMSEWHDLAVWKEGSAINVLESIS